MKEMIDFLADTDVTEEFSLPQGYTLPPAMNCNDCVLESVGLSQAYVPYQNYETLFAPEQGLVCGTAFPSLVMPYTQGTHLKQYAKEDSAWNKK